MLEIPVPPSSGYEKLDDYTADSTNFSSGTISVFVNRETRHLIAYVSAVWKAYPSGLLTVLPAGYNPVNSVVYSGAALINNTEGARSTKPAMISKANYNQNLAYWIHGANQQVGDTLVGEISWNY